jgi:hypothetical protein
MKTKKLCVFLLIVALAVLFSAGEEAPKPLAEIYKKGTVRFVPDLILSENSLPPEALLESVTDIKYDLQGNIYFCDFRANNIKKFDPAGKFLKTIGRKGQGPGDFNMPFLLAVTTDRLFVWDMGNRRLCSLTLDGDFIKSMPMQFSQGMPTKMEALPDRNILIGMEKANRGEENGPQDYSIEIYSPELEHKGTLYTQQIWRNKYGRFEGITTYIQQPFTPLVYWDVATDGEIIIGFSKNYEIEVYSSDRRKLFSFKHAYKPVKVTAKDKQEFFEGLMYSVDGVRTSQLPDFIIKNTEFPAEKPAFSHLKVDSDGNILVWPYRPKREEEGIYLDAFDPRGKFIGQGRLSGSKETLQNFSASKIYQGKFWSNEVDKAGQVTLIRYRISD